MEWSDIFNLFYSCSNIFKDVESLNLNLNHIKLYYAQLSYLKRDNRFGGQCVCSPLSGASADPLGAQTFSASKHGSNAQLRNQIEFLNSSWLTQLCP